jgi:hypothetical protein
VARHPDVETIKGKGTRIIHLFHLSLLSFACATWLTWLVISTFFSEAIRDMQLKHMKRVDVVIEVPHV